MSPYEFNRTGVLRADTGMPGSGYKFSHPTSNVAVLARVKRAMLFGVAPSGQTVVTKRL